MMYFNTKCSYHINKRVLCDRIGTLKEFDAANKGMILVFLLLLLPTV